MALTLVKLEFIVPHCIKIEAIGDFTTKHAFGVSVAAKFRLYVISDGYLIRLAKTLLYKQEKTKIKIKINTELIFTICENTLSITIYKLSITGY